MRTIVSPLRAIRLQAAELAVSHVNPAGAEGHLGGYGTGPLGDRATYHPNLWSWAIGLLGIRSVIDIGCGEGASTRFFLDAGCDVLGVEGHRQAVRNSRVPGRVVLHDYAEGPFVPDRAFDMAWCCEFVEHIEERFLPNFFATLERTACVLMTFARPGQGGHHHVNEQEESYWVGWFERHRFVLDEDLTACGRLVAVADRCLVSPDYPSHFTDKGLVFVRQPAPADPVSG